MGILRIVLEQLAIWLGANRAVWENDPASFSVNLGMGTIADPKFAGFVAQTLKTHKVSAKAIGFEVTEKSCVEQVRDVDRLRGGTRMIRRFRDRWSPRGWG